MQEWLAALESWPLAQHVRAARWEYVAVNATHIFAIGLLVGAIVSLNLRLLGLWRSVPLTQLSRVLVPVAATGLALAAVSGALMFSTRATEYAPLAVFQTKMGLVTLGTLAALSLHWTHGANLDTAAPARLRAHAVISLSCWLGALACGRIIAFVLD